MKAFVFLTALLLSAGNVFAGPILWLGDDQGQIGTVDVATGAAAVIGPTNIGQGNFTTDLAFSPSGTLFGIDFQNLYTIDTGSGNATLIGAFGGDIRMNALVFGTDGTLYGAGWNSTGTPISTLYSLNTLNGQATQLGTIGDGTIFSAGDLAFFGGDLFLTAADGSLFQINLTNPSLSASVGNMGPAGNSFGLATGDNATLYAVNGFNIYSVNSNNGSSTLAATYVGNASGLGAATGSAFFAEAVAAEVPEPASLGLWGLGSLGLAWSARRRRKASQIG